VNASEFSSNQGPEESYGRPAQSGAIYCDSSKVEIFQINFTANYPFSFVGTVSPPRCQGGYFAIPTGPDRGSCDSCPEGKYTEPMEKPVNYYREKGKSLWGGSCTCPDGQVYQVSDNGDGCGSLACEGGISGECNRKSGWWSMRKVTCGNPSPLQTSSTTCSECPAGRYGAQERAQHLDEGCKLCPAGYHQSNSANTTCETCMAGRYGRFEGEINSACTNACPAHVRASCTAGSSILLVPKSGHYYATTKVLEPCPSGKYKSTLDLEACESCPGT
jgi:hypothetical protein